jgi:phosphoglycerol transferase MdoB-like AlkP superfamily enzyme
MAKYGVSRKVLLIMTLNIILDSTIGAIPIIGNIFDFAYKSNSRNIKLLKEHYEEGKHQGSAKGIIAWIAIILLLSLVLVVYVLWSVLSWLIDLI